MEEPTSDKNTIVLPKNSSSVDVHDSDVSKTIVRLPRCVKDILVAHLYDDPMRDQTDTCDVSVDTINSV